MNYEYRKNAETYKKFNAKELFGLPTDVELLFNNIYVRVYKSHEHDGYFSCSLAVPYSQDDDGYVLEFEFTSASLDDKLDSLEEEVGSSFELDLYPGDSNDWEYEVPLSGCSFDTISQAMSCEISEVVELGRRFLVFNLKITDTPFCGSATIRPDLYQVKS